MGVFGALETAWEQAHALPAAWRTLRDTGNPILAVRRYAEATGNTVDDQLPVKLEDVVRAGIQHLETMTGWCADAAMVVTNIGYRAGHWRAVARVWLDEAEGGGGGHATGQDDRR